VWFGNNSQHGLAIVAVQRMIDLTKLQTFIQVVQSSSFSEAAERLHLSQPTISHHIKTLEQDLGLELFDRAGGRLRLTQAGAILLPRARKLLRDAIELQQLFESLEDKIIGQITIACSTTTGKYILPQFAARFHARHSGVNVAILRCTAARVVTNLLKEDADLGVVSYEACGEGMECQDFFTDHIILIVPADHPWAEREYVEPADLLEVPVIIREPSSGTRLAMLAELGKHNIILDDMDIFLEVGNAEAIVKTVEAGFGVSFVSRLAAVCALEKGVVVEVPIVGFDIRRKIYLVRPDINAANRVVEAFWGFVHDPVNRDLLRLAEK
jgi:DNA-binding transcriptional LysR family regulator